jgi:hypothetical protein
MAIILNSYQSKIIGCRTAPLYFAYKADLAGGNGIGDAE